MRDRGDLTLILPPSFVAKQVTESVHLLVDRGGGGVASEKLAATLALSIGELLAARACEKEPDTGPGYSGRNSILRLSTKKRSE